MVEDKPKAATATNVVSPKKLRGRQAAAAVAEPPPQGKPAAGRPAGRPIKPVDSAKSNAGSVSSTRSSSTEVRSSAPASGRRASASSSKSASTGAPPAAADAGEEKKVSAEHLCWMEPTDNWLSNFSAE